LPLQQSPEGRIAAAPRLWDLCAHEHLEPPGGREGVQAGRSCAALCGLKVFDATPRSGSARGIHEIPVEAIKGTTEPNRAAQFDQEFRPKSITRSRWLSIWHACHRGVTLPPISVVRVGDAYAIRDGHHRVSVARALGAPSISAIVA
jgi:hypothetical protein